MDPGALAFLQVIVGAFILLLGLLVFLRVLNWLVALLGGVDYSSRRAWVLLLLVVALVVAATSVVVLLLAEHL